MLGHQISRGDRLSGHQPDPSGDGARRNPRQRRLLADHRRRQEGLGREGADQRTSSSSRWSASPTCRTSRRSSELVTKPEDRALIPLLAGSAALGRAWIAFGDIPKERLAALRDAWAKTMADPAFQADAQGARDRAPSGRLANPAKARRADSGHARRHRGAAEGDTGVEVAGLETLTKTSIAANMTSHRPTRSSSASTMDRRRRCSRAKTTNGSPASAPARRWAS